MAWLVGRFAGWARLQRGRKAGAGRGEGADLRLGRLAERFGVADGRRSGRPSTVDPRHVLALTEQGAVYSFGSGGSGRLGHDGEPFFTMPKRIEALRSVRVVAVAAGALHNLVLSAAGEVYSFGNGAYGALGHGGRERQSPPSA